MRALVRPPGRTYPDALTRLDPRPRVDLALAREQHAGYVASLRAAGVEVTVLAPDDAHPDAVFVQDRICVVDGRAIVALSAVEARRGETEALVEVLGRSFPVASLQSPACLDWGDVLISSGALLVGLSERSNAAAVEGLARLVGPARRVEGVALPGDLLHLLSGCAPLDDATVLTVASLEPLLRERGFRTVAAPPEEASAANVLALGRRVLVPAGNPCTAAAITREGFEVVFVPVSEFEKRDGGLTCLSVVY